MTSLVALMNKNGVVLAADSAVTIGEGIKIFQTASKIFDLSPSHQIGIMTYGDANFCGIPWEIILNGYKVKMGEDPQENLESYVNEFIDFLSKDTTLFKKETIEYNLHQYTIRHVHLIDKNVDEKINEMRIRCVPETQIHEQILLLLKEELDSISTQNYLEHITKDMASKFTDDYLLDLQNVIKQYRLEENYGEVEEDVLKIFAQYSIDAMLRDCKWEDGSAIVFVGFGSQDIFPSLVELRFKGYFGNILAYKEEQIISITQEHPAECRPFAQNIPIFEFVTGMGEDVYNLIHGFLHKSLPEILKSATETLDPPIVLDEDAIGKLIDTIKAGFDKEEKDFLVDHNLKLRDVLQFWGLPELVTAAENLLNLVILRGKLSTMPETVGGPIDVAIISKANGFERIKQKYIKKD